MANNDSAQRIEPEPTLKWWRTEIPNLYDDADLDVYEFRLLVHYVRVGNCWEGVRRTAEKCHMSVGKVVETRRSLESKGYITTSGGNDGETFTIKVVDRWEENFTAFSKGRYETPGVHHVNDDAEECSCGELGVHVVNADCSRGERKNNSSKKEHIKNGGAAGALAPAGLAATPPPVDDPPVEVEAGPIAPTVHTAASREYFRQFRRHRWATLAQRDAFMTCEREVGGDAMLAAVRWAAVKGVSDVGAICTAARTNRANGGKKPAMTAQGRAAPPPPKPPRTVDPFTHQVMED